MYNLFTAGLVAWIGFAFCLSVSDGKGFSDFWIALLLALAALVYHFLIHGWFYKDNLKDFDEEYEWY